MSFTEWVDLILHEFIANHTCTVRPLGNDLQIVNFRDQAYHWTGFIWFSTQYYNIPLDFEYAFYEENNILPYSAIQCKWFRFNSSAVMIRQNLDKTAWMLKGNLTYALRDISKARSAILSVETN